MPRLMICLRVARGLNYLHDHMDTKQRVLHRDIKSSNILLNEEWNAKISDFGLSKVGPANQPHTYLVSNVVGTLGYCDPSYFETGLLSKESDVYSFGVVLFEVMCGRLCCESRNGEKIRILLPMWKECFEEKRLDDIIFHDLKEQIQHDCLMTFSTIAYRCLLRDHKKRPTMVQIIQELEDAIEQQLGINKNEDSGERKYTGVRLQPALPKTTTSIVNSGGDHDVVTEKDLQHLLHLLDGKDAVWQRMMERSTLDMAFEAWRYEPETGPIVYRSRTVFEYATSKLVRDFLWDDEFRPKWDQMLAYFKILEEYHGSGTMIVHWIKKFPFFCSDREYIIGRRIWEAGKTYYCVTKGVPYPALRRRDKPKRVDHYFSSWVISPVESRNGDGVLLSCEVILLHCEDMGIPRDVAKLVVRHEMWGTMKKLHGGFRAYQNARKQDSSISRCALMAAIATKISFDGGVESVLGEQKTGDVKTCGDDGSVGGGVDWRWLAVGAAVAVMLRLFFIKEGRSDFFVYI